jgi:anti-sigma-K factor RskA
MSPEELEKLQVLSGEYVLGVLDGEAAREVEVQLAINPELRRAIAFWEGRLEGLSALAPPADPPAGAWDRIAVQLKPAAQRRPARQIWDSISLWRWSTAGAGLLAACLALYIAVAPRSASPAYVAVLRPPQQDQAAWVATAGTNGLLVRAVAQTPAPNDRSFELWAIAPGAAQPPQPLGVIRSDGRLEIGALPAALRDGGTLAISIEPLGGSPTGQPTGPVVFSGTLVAAR